MVLVQLEDEADPETGQRYTVKRYRSEKTAGSDSWRHLAITPKPDKPGVRGDHTHGGRRRARRGGGGVCGVVGRRGVA